MNEKKKTNYVIIIISVLLFAILVFGVLYFIIHPETVSTISNNNQNEILNSMSSEEEVDIFENIELVSASLEKYTVYGTHLNFNISVNNSDDLDNIYDAKIILKNMQGDETNYDADYIVENDKILFSTSDKINTGIDLESINQDEYYILLKVITNKVSYGENGDKKETKKEHYYNIENNTEYKDIEYYTITRKKKNNKIDIKENKIKNRDVNTLCMNVKESKLPANVYDIVIDAGHGGEDCGASANGYTESELTLDYAFKLKEKFDKLGLKVKLTRNENETRMDTYGEDGRYVIANSVKAKFQLSVHLNSGDSDLTGVEVYCPNSSNLKFAENLANNLVLNCNTSYSQNNTWKENDGVYVRNFNDAAFEEVLEYARELGFEPYNVSYNTAYYGVIRESGGIMTGAYIDGRDPTYENNPYYNSNMGVETYLLELGYITNLSNIENIIANEESYTDVIVETTKDYLNLK